MKELLDKIFAQMEAFTFNANLNLEKGNKAAGLRARKATLELEKSFKQYRKETINNKR